MEKHNFPIFSEKYCKERRESARGVTVFIHTPGPSSSLTPSTTLRRERNPEPKGLNRLSFIYHVAQELVASISVLGNPIHLTQLPKNCV